MSRRMFLALSNSGPIFDVELTYDIPDSAVSRSLIQINTLGVQTINIDWGDGVVEDRQVNATALSHSYTNPGTYTAKFTNSGGEVRSISIPTAGRNVLTRIEKLKSTTLISINSLAINSVSLNYIGECDIPLCSNFGGAFSGCTGIISNVPEFWITNGSTATSFANCYLNCTNAANYTDIPNTWKGL